MMNNNYCICYTELKEKLVYNMQDILHTEEIQKIDKCSIGRKEEFIGGRLAAKSAFLKVTGKDLSLPQICILNDFFGAPYFTEAKYFCSISHNKGIAIAAVSKIDELRMGIDIQRRKTIRKDLTGYYINDKEKEILKHLDNYDADYLYTVVWSAKESISKLLQYGFTLFGLLEIERIEPMDNYIMVYFKNIKALCVRVENLGDSVVSLAANNKFMFNLTRGSIKFHEL